MEGNVTYCQCDNILNREQKIHHSSHYKDPRVAFRTLPTATELCRPIVRELN